MNTGNDMTPYNDVTINTQQLVVEIISFFKVTL